MRLWTLHPRYLDAKGLVAVWREALLAQKVLAGLTRGYTRHPQLTRFREHKRPLKLIGAFLSGIADEAERRGYAFDRSRIREPNRRCRVSETRGQLLFEWEHLQAKLRVRAAELCCHLPDHRCPAAHAVFRIVPGNVRDWEKRLTARRPAKSQPVGRRPNRASTRNSSGR